MSLLRLQSEPSSCSPRTAVRQLMPVFRIATFNVLCGYSFGPCAWSERQQLIHRSIEAARPDVLGLQEISSSRLADAADLWRR
jgi:mRNA deadenylase 3'-5' endonuclease subunit Ccr4